MGHLLGVCCQQATMFKKPNPMEAVPHRMGGLHAKRDPLLDEKVGSQRKRVNDDRLYKETVEEKHARLGADKKAKKEKKSIPTQLTSFKDRLKASSLPHDAAE